MVRMIRFHKVISLPKGVSDKINIKNWEWKLDINSLINYILAKTHVDWKKVILITLQRVLQRKQTDLGIILQEEILNGTCRDRAMIIGQILDDMKIKNSICHIGIHAYNYIKWYWYLDFYLWEKENLYMINSKLWLYKKYILKSYKKYILKEVKKKERLKKIII